MSFSFTDGTDFKLANGYDSNCEAITAIYFSAVNGNMDELSILSSKTVSTIKVAGRAKIDFSQDEADALRRHLKCLALHINDEDEFVQEEPTQSLPQQPIQELPEVTFEERRDSVKRKAERPVVKYAPAFLGGEEALSAYIRNNIKYPASAIKMGIEGTVKVAFTVKETGEVTDIRIQNGIGSECDIEVFRVVKAMPRWEPAVFDSAKVPATASLMIAFNAKTKQANYVAPRTMEYSFVVAEASPEYVGGYDAMMTFIHRNIKWPIEALREQKKGTIHLSFIVSRDGSIKDVKVLKSVHPALEAAAINVVRAMPPWKPGQQNGKSVDVRYNLPIRFAFEVSQKKK